jgi:sporulation protein YabP
MVKDPAEGKRPPARAHAVVMENRKRAQVTGVTDVASFNEQEVIMLTEEGDISLVGEGLHISHLNLEEGKLTVEGRIAGIEYGDAPTQRRSGILSRVFR